MTVHNSPRKKAILQRFRIGNGEYCDRIDDHVVMEFRMGSLHEIICFNVEIPPWKPKVKLLGL